MRVQDPCPKSKRAADPNAGNTNRSFEAAQGGSIKNPQAMRVRRETVAHPSPHEMRMANTLSHERLPSRDRNALQSSATTSRANETSRN